MSASRCLVFLGIRFEVPPNEVEAVERRIDPRMKKAQANKLQCYWSDFGSEGEHYYLFVGKNIGVFGIEDRSELQMEMAEINGLAAETSSRLARAGFASEPILYVHWEEDA